MFKPLGRPTAESAPAGPERDFPAQGEPVSLMKGSILQAARHLIPVKREAPKGPSGLPSSEAAPSLQSPGAWDGCLAEIKSADFLT